ncbi:MAG: FUSC family protein [Aphanocapsa sp. GSE-SYN-MK-11-07L]|nr:FUSC family protein [Aphanocapsa sp. GSE-SYN-MK-11-07L]
MLVKHALKTAIAAGILAALFQNSDLAHIQYPVMGLLATMLSSVGDTVKAGWGRLGGSVVAGVFSVLIVGTFGISPIAAGSAFILASLFCEVLGWKALVGQAGIIAALIAAEPELGADPAIYTVHRVFDNSIGVFVATAVTVLFWPERPRLTLQNYLVRVLGNCNQCLQKIVSSVGGEASPLIAIEQHTTEMYCLIQQSDSLLSRSLYGFLGRQLVQDNWSDLLATERRLRRHLLGMTRIVKDDHQNSLMPLFSDQLQRLAEEVSDLCAVTTELIRGGMAAKAAAVELPHLSHHLAGMVDRLGQMRATNSLVSYPIHETIQFYSLLSLLTRLSQDLEQLADKLQHQEKVAELPGWQFKLHPVPAPQVKHYLKTGIALGLTIAIVDFAQLPYGYYAALGLVVGMQPTLGKGLSAGKQRVLGTAVGALVAIVLVNTLGSNPFTVGLGMMATIVGCARLGMDMAGYKGGCFLMAIAIMIHSSEPNSYIWGRFSQTLLGVGIAIAVYWLFPADTAAQKIDPSLHQAFGNLGQLYEQIVTNYLQGIDSTATTAKLSEQIRQAIKTQTSLQTETKLELIEDFRAATIQRRWNFLISHERALFSSLLSLQQVAVSSTSTAMSDSFLAELQTAMQTTSLGFQAVAAAIPDQLPKAPNLLTPFQVLEQQMEKLRPTQTMSKYDVNQMIAFFGVISALQEVAENLNQMSQHWPGKQVADQSGL